MPRGNDKNFMDRATPSAFKAYIKSHAISAIYIRIDRYRQYMNRIPTIGTIANFILKIHKRVTQVKNKKRKKALHSQSVSCRSGIGQRNDTRSAKTGFKSQYKH